MAQQPPRTGRQRGAAGELLRAIRRTGTPSPTPADPLAAIGLLLAGLFGVGQLFLSWTSIVFSVNLPSDGGLTGWQVFRTANSGASLSATAAIGAYSVIGVGVVGALLLLLALAVLTPLPRKPVGGLALTLSMLAVAGALYWVVRAHHLTSRSLGEIFDHAGPGWYLFLLTGVTGVLGAWKALTDR